MGAAGDVHRALEGSVEKRTSASLGPPAGKRLVVFVDDVSMPTVDPYGTMQPIAFLRLLVDKEAWYPGPPAGGRVGRLSRLCRSCRWRWSVDCLIPLSFSSVVVCCFFGRKRRTKKNQC